MSGSPGGPEACARPSEMQQDAAEDSENEGEDVAASASNSGQSKQVYGNVFFFYHFEPGFVGQRYWFDQSTGKLPEKAEAAKD